MARSNGINSFRLLMFMVFLHIFEIYGQNCKKNTFKEETPIQVRYNFDLVHFDPVNLTISGCISPLTLGDFKEDTILILYCNDQDIPELFEEAVSNLSNLTLLHLQRNKIRTIKKGAFSNLPVVHVYLTDNEIESLDDEIFMNVPNLNSISLNRNKLQEFNWVWIGKQVQLYDLNLAENSIHVLSKNSFKNLNGLKFLNVSHNQIEHIDEQAFSELSNLLRLDLGYNKIKRLHDNLFLPFKKLEILNLFSNNLSYVSEETLENLQKVKYVITLHNPWLCGCYNKMMQWGINLNDWDYPYFFCDGKKDIENSLTCVVTEETECVADYNKDLLSVLVSQQSDYRCYFVYMWPPMRDGQVSTRKPKDE